MRGHDGDFLIIEPGIGYSMLLVRDAVKYWCHYVDVGGRRMKLNCHGDSCPFCDDGYQRHKRYYALALLKGGVLKYLDMSQFLAGKIYEALLSHRQETSSRDLTPMGHALSIERADGDRVSYDISLADVPADSFAEVMAHAASLEDYGRLVDGLEHISAPGSMKEDFGLIKKVCGERVLS